MCDPQEKDHMHGKTANSKSQQMKHHHQTQGHHHHHDQQKLDQSDDNDSNVSHSTEDSIFSDHHSDQRHQCDNDTTHHSHSHHYIRKQNHHRASHSEMPLNSSTGSSSSSSSSSSTPSSSSSSSSSSFSSSSSTSSSSSSLSSESSRKCLDSGPLKKPQHSQSCTDISRKHRYYEEGDDTAPLIDRKSDPNRLPAKQQQEKGKSSHSGPTQGTLKNKRRISRGSGNDGLSRKARSMEALTRPKESQWHVNEDENEPESRKGEARKEKMKFSAFLNEITRQVLSPMRLTTLGVTDPQRPCSPGQASLRSSKVDSSTKKLREQRSRPASPDSITSSMYSHTNKHSSRISHSEAFHHPHRHRSADSPHHMCHRPKSCSDVSCLKRRHSWSQTPAHHSHSPSHKHHHPHQGDHHTSSHHHHHGNCNSPRYYHHHRDHHNTSHHHHHGAHHSPTNHHGDHTSHHRRHSTSHQDHCEDNHQGDQYSPTHCVGEHHSITHHRNHEDHHSPAHHYRHGDHHGHVHHCEGQHTPTHHHLVHQSSGHHRHSKHPNIKHTTTPGLLINDCGDHHHSDHHNPTHHHHHVDHHVHSTDHHHHVDHHSEAHQHHHGDYHSTGHRHHDGDHHSESHQHHHGDQHSPDHQNHHGDHHSESHQNHHKDHHSSGHQHHHGDHHSTGHRHHGGDHHSESHQHRHGDQHSPDHQNHHGDQHSPDHQNHHGDHHSESHQNHHKDHHSSGHQHHHRDHHNSGHQHHHGDHHNPDQKHHHEDHNGPGHQHHHRDHHSPDQKHHPEDHHGPGHQHHHGDHHSSGHQHPHRDYYSTCHHKGHHLESQLKQPHSKNNDFDHDDQNTNLKGHSASSPPSQRKLDSLSTKTDSPRNSSSPSSQEEEQTSFSGSSLHKEKPHELGRIIMLQEQNEGLHQSLLKTAVRMECLGEEFMSSQKLLEAELQRTRMELCNLTERFKRLHDNCSSTQQTNNLLEQKLHSVAQSMEGERERLNRRISALTEKLADAKFDNSVETFNVKSVLHRTNLHFQADDAINQVVPPITPPPAEFMDIHNYGNSKAGGQEQPLGSVPEEEESDWSEMGEEPPRFILTGSNRGQAWRQQEGDVDKDGESWVEEIVRRHSPRAPQVPHLQFTIHNENLSDVMTGEGTYRITTSPALCSTILIRSASMEEIPLARHHMQKELRGTEAMMNLHHQGDEAIDDLDNEIIHHWRTSKDRDAAIGRPLESRTSEADSNLAGLQSAERMLNYFICEPQLGEGTGQGRAHGWTGGIPDNVLRGERTQL